MLDLKTIQNLQNLLAQNLYHAEVAHLPRLSREEEQSLVAKARRGDEQAREALIVCCCLRYVRNMAWRIWKTRRPAYDEALDLVQIASVAMLEALDSALTKPNPVAYLSKIATRQMSIYLTYRGDFFQKPHVSLEELDRMDIPTVESLDKPLSQERRTRIKMDIIEVATPPDDSEVLDREARHEQRFAPLYAALDQLTRREKAMFVKRFALGIEADTAKQNGMPTDGVRKLRKMLAPYVTKMLYPEQQEEEE